MLLTLAIVGAAISGAVLGMITDTFFRSRNPNAPQFLLGCLTISAGMLVLRSFVQPALHWQRIQAREGRWIECLYLLTFFLVGLAITFDWPAWCAALASFGLLIGAVILVGRLAGSAGSRWDDRCPICGYDLRGSPEPRCPECGAEY